MDVFSSIDTKSLEKQKKKISATGPLMYYVSKSSANFDSPSPLFLLRRFSIKTKNYPDFIFSYSKFYFPRQKTKFYTQYFEAISKLEPINMTFHSFTYFNACGFGNLCEIFSKIRTLKAKRNGIERVSCEFCFTYLLICLFFREFERFILFYVISIVDIKHPFFVKTERQ